MGVVVVELMVVVVVLLVMVVGDPSNVNVCKPSSQYMQNV